MSIFKIYGYGDEVVYIKSEELKILERLCCPSKNDIFELPDGSSFRLFYGNEGWQVSDLSSKGINIKVEKDDEDEEYENNECIILEITDIKDFPYILQKRYGGEIYIIPINIDIVKSNFSCKEYTLFKQLLRTKGTNGEEGLFNCSEAYVAAITKYSSISLKGNG